MIRMMIMIRMMGEDNNLQTSQRKCRALCPGPRIWQTQGPDPRNCQSFSSIWRYSMECQVSFTLKVAACVPDRTKAATMADDII